MIPEFSDIVIPMLGLIVFFAVARKSGMGRTQKIRWR
jgi:hypothetical protein